MFKKALQFVTTFGVLLACYAGYVRIFAIIAAGIGPAAEPAMTWKRKESKTQQEATRMAAAGYGPRHWSADPDLPVRYYNHEHAYWMYAKNYERLNDGKQLRLWPFAIVSTSQNGKVLKTATSDVAIVDLDQSLGLVNKSGAPMKVVRARMEGNVQLRDDKGTPRSTLDDLVIGPMPYVEFDEPSLQIKSDSDIVIKDRDMRITGFGLLIQLRPKEGAAPAASASAAGNFEAKTVYLKKNVHITINDVGRSGILPGQAEPTQAQRKGQGAGEGRTPLDVRCAGEMRVELPKPKKGVEVGPPAPPSPTLIYFARDVVVKRARPSLTPGGPALPPDQLDCDELRLTMLPTPKLMPKPKPPGSKLEVDPTEPAPAATGAGTEMTLREALATGHAVWLQSPGQGITARCNELIHKKLSPERADETYLRGDSKTKLWVEKIETAAAGPNKGKAQSVTTIRTIDATIFEDGKGSENATIVARGPGLLETRPARDQPVERKAIWQDHLVIKTDFDANNQPMKKVTLTGRPEFIDLAQASLDAEKEINVWLTPKAKAPVDPAVTAASANKPADPSAPGSSDTFQIKQLKALGNVHLIAPGKVMTARNELDAVFEPVPPVPPTVNGKAKPAAPTATPRAAEEKKAPDPVGPDEKPNPAAKPKPTDPEVTVTADRVWALIRMKPDAEPSRPPADAASKPTSSPSEMEGGEVRLVMLRGGVVFHQDPEPGKTQGSDVTGEALDVTNQGDGKMKFVVQHHLNLKGASAAELALTPHARVSTEEMTITGPHIGLDQAADYAWVEGAGTLTQMAPRGLLTDKGLGETPRDDKDQANEKAKARDAKVANGEATEKANLRPFTISWKSKMEFYGRPAKINLRGKPVALAQFYNGVRAVMDDAQLACQERLDVYMDRYVSLARPKGASKEVAVGEEPEPKPQISLIDCFSDVVVESRKIDPDTRVLLQKQRIEGDRVTYDKLTGNFHVPGAGKVALWNREEGADNPLAAPAPAAPSTATGRTIKPASNPAAPPPVRRATDVVGRNGSQIPIPPARAGVGARAGAGAATAAAGRGKPGLAPLKVTLITFDTEMTGRYVAGKDSDTTETRWASFLGDVQTLNATVASENTEVDFDRPPDDYVFLTSQKMDVSSTPTPGKTSAARNYLMAVDAAQAKTRHETIKADVITYDSQKMLFYAYAEEGRPITLLRQDAIGQPTSSSLGQAVKYNRNTGESQLINPMSPIEFVQAKSGLRPGPSGEAKQKKIKTPRNGPGLKIPVPSQTERRGMTGR